MFATLLGASALAVPSYSHIPIPPREPTEIGRRMVKLAVPDFKLTDQEGKPFQFTMARGKVVLVNFIFTTCPDVCPLLTAKMATIQRSLEKNHNKNYFLLTITTDPERDTAPILKEYAGRFKADLSQWRFLTGTRQELPIVWKIFGVNVTKTAAGEIQHTTLTTLVDRHGNRRVDYYGDKWQDNEVLRDIQWLRSQK
jgi:protein SCO1/2